MANALRTCPRDDLWGASTHYHGCCHKSTNVDMQFSVPTLPVVTCLSTSGPGACCDYDESIDYNRTCISGCNGLMEDFQEQTESVSSRSTKLAFANLTFNPKVWPTTSFSSSCIRPLKPAIDLNSSTLILPNSLSYTLLHFPSLSLSYGTNSKYFPNQEGHCTVYFVAHVACEAPVAQRFRASCLYLYVYQRHTKVASSILAWSTLNFDMCVIQEDHPDFWFFHFVLIDLFFF